MEGQQRQRSGGGRRRRRKARPQARPANVEPVIVAARRPNSPLLVKNGRSVVAASASPQSPKRREKSSDSAAETAEVSGSQRRSARIVRLETEVEDATEQERQRLLDRVRLADGRGAVSRAARIYIEEGFVFPMEQEIQLQLLEHMDEDVACDAIAALSELLERDPPLKKPVLEQRLRRMEEYGDDPKTREAAAELLRAIR